MLKATINITHCKSLNDIHEEIKTALNLPSYYGKNLSALWDCLTGHIDYPITISIIGLDQIQQPLLTDALEILKVFLCAEEEIPEIHIITHRRDQL